MFDRKTKCCICGNEFSYGKPYNKKTCSSQCSYELKKQISLRNGIEKVERICLNCNKKYISLKKWKGKGLCLQCLYKEESLKRINKKNPNYKNGKYIGEKNPQRNLYTSKHLRACSKYKKEFLKNNDYLFCEHCGVNINGAKKFETHHLYFASRHPNHKELHNFKNLILLCITCHNTFHNGLEGKKILEHYEKERELKKLFKIKI